MKKLNSNSNANKIVTPIISRITKIVDKDLKFKIRFVMYLNIIVDINRNVL